MSPPLGTPHVHPFDPVTSSRCHPENTWVRTSGNGPNAAPPTEPSGAHLDELRTGAGALPWKQARVLGERTYIGPSPRTIAQLREPLHLEKPAPSLSGSPGCKPQPTTYISPARTPRNEGPGLMQICNAQWDLDYHPTKSYGVSIRDSTVDHPVFRALASAAPERAGVSHGRPSAGKSGSDMI